MLKITCTKCGKENNITKEGNYIDTDGDIIIATGDYVITYLSCPCGYKITTQEQNQ